MVGKKNTVKVSFIIFKSKSASWKQLRLLCASKDSLFIRLLCSWDEASQLGHRGGDRLAERILGGGGVSRADCDGSLATEMNSIEKGKKRWSDGTEVKKLHSPGGRDDVAEKRKPELKPKEKFC